MRLLSILLLNIILLALFTISACGVGGDVVKVTNVKHVRDADLGEAELAKLKEIKKEKEGLAPGLRDVIGGTPHFSVAEYLKQHHDAGNSGSRNYRVGGFDVLSITIYEEEDLSREEIRVSGEGFISFPLIGRISVAGLTTSEIERLICNRLAEKEYLLDAHASVMIIEFNSKGFLVLGEVKEPGSYSLKARERVLDGISRAGGLRRLGEDWGMRTGAGKKCMIIRVENSNTPKERKIVIEIDLQRLLKRGDRISNIYLADKDVLFIPTAEHFYIIGQVRRPGSYALPDKEITLIEAISMAEGFTPIAARNSTRIIRVENDVEKIIEVKVDAITRAGQKIKDVIIRADDVIIVPESFF